MKSHECTHTHFVPLPTVISPKVSLQRFPSTRPELPLATLTSGRWPYFAFYWLSLSQDFFMLVPFPLSPSPESPSPSLPFPYVSLPTSALPLCLPPHLTLSPVSPSPPFPFPCLPLSSSSLSFLSFCTLNYIYLPILFPTDPKHNFYMILPTIHPCSQSTGIALPRLHLFSHLNSYVQVPRSLTPCAPYYLPAQLATSLIGLSQRSPLKY